MLQRVRLCLCATTAAVVMAIVAPSAVATRIRIANQPIRAVWTGLIANQGMSTFNCNVTMEGSFHSRTLIKTAGSLVGHIYGVNWNTCGAEGDIRFLRETLPWHVKYREYGGTLPTITDVRFGIVRLAYLIVAGSAYSCLYASTEMTPTVMVFNVGRSTEIASVAIAGEFRITLARSLAGIMMCPAESAMGGGTGSIVGLNTITLA